MLKIATVPYLDRYQLLAWLFIGLAIGGALLTVFFPPVIPFIVSLPYLSFLAGVSVPLLGLMAGAAMALVTTSFAAVIIALLTKPSKGYRKLDDKVDSKEVGALATTSSALSLQQVGGQKAVVDETKHQPAIAASARDLTEVLAVSKPLFVKLDQGQIKVTLGYFCFPGYKNAELVLSPGQTSKEFFGLTVTYNKNGTFAIDLIDVIFGEFHQVKLGEQDDIIFDAGRVRAKLPANVTCQVTYKQAQASLAL